MDNNNSYEQGNQNTAQSEGFNQDRQPQPENFNQSRQPQPNFSQSYYQQQQYDQGRQQPPYNQGYQQPPYSQGYQQPDGDLEEPVSFGDWMLTMLLMMIPCVNIIMVFVWAFGNGTKKSKSNYFKATLVWAVIWIVIVLLMLIGIGGMAASLTGLYYY
ncbi:MAG: hypothetical protein LUE96_10295 [Lachnospiraceae bacterium]|nr:hypothetical protein [Lachnospiraceae bacterium]